MCVFKPDEASPLHIGMVILFVFCQLCLFFCVFFSVFVCLFVHRGIYLRDCVGFYVYLFVCDCLPESTFRLFTTLHIRTVTVCPCICFLMAYLSVCIFT